MKIEDKIEKYLKEGKMKKAQMKKAPKKKAQMKNAPKKKALEKTIKAIKSAKTDEQLKIATKMAANFYQLYGENFINDLKQSISPRMFGKLEKKIIDIIDNQKDKIDHMKKVNK
jgi:predicted lipid-binding transport protein (Tim44 family)